MSRIDRLYQPVKVYWFGYREANQDDISQTKRFATEDANEATNKMAELIGAGFVVGSIQVAWEQEETQ